MIFYFSATGNSKYVANRLARALDSEIVSIVDCLKNGRLSFEIQTDERVGFVFPTYAWGLPSVAQEFMQRMELHTNGSAYFYFVATFGPTPGTIGYTANQQLYARTGRKFDARFGVKMPDTWTPMFDLSDKEKVQQINDRAEPQIDRIIQRARHYTGGNYLKSRVPRFLIPIFEKYYDYMRKTSHFTVESSCIGCGLCEQNCPADAIRLENGTPVWTTDRCAMCLGCLHRCPHFAIQYGKNTQKHGQYLNPHT